jgi:protein-tyrosine-phosphatase
MEVFPDARSVGLLLNYTGHIMIRDKHHQAPAREVLFVCTVNRHRSVLAEHLFRRTITRRFEGFGNTIRISSAGIVTRRQKSELRKKGIHLPKPLYGYRPMPCVILHMQKVGIDVSECRSKSITERTASNSDLIIGMDESHKEGILDTYPETRDKVFTLVELSRPFDFRNINAQEPPGLMPPAKFCMLECNHWSVTDIVLRQVQERLDEAFEDIIDRLHLKT